MLEVIVFCTSRCTSRSLSLMYSFSISTHQSIVLSSSVNNKGILHSLSSESFTLVKIDARVGMKFCIRVKGGKLVAHWIDLLIIGRSLDDSEARDNLKCRGLGAIHLLLLDSGIEKLHHEGMFFLGANHILVQYAREEQELHMIGFGCEY